jgi:hypothetical protein
MLILRRVEIFTNLVVVVSLGFMIFTKISLLNNRETIDRLDFMILSLKQEERLLELELNLLTDPRRLEGLYEQLQNKYFVENSVLNYHQLKDLNNLYPYFYSKKETLNTRRMLAKR